MRFLLTLFALTRLVHGAEVISGGVNGDAVTTRYWCE